MNTAITQNSSPAMKEADKAFIAARRDYFLDNLFIDQYVREEFDPDEDYQIWVLDGLDRRFISLQANHWDHPTRIFVYPDGTVFTGAAGIGCGGIFMPTRDDSGWYIGDEMQQVGEIELGKNDHWKNMVGILEDKHVNVYNVSKPTLEMIIEKFDLGA